MGARHSLQAQDLERALQHYVWIRSSPHLPRVDVALLVRVALYYPDAESNAALDKMTNHLPRLEQRAWVRDTLASTRELDAVRRVRDTPQLVSDTMGWPL